MLFNKNTAESKDRPYIKIGAARTVKPFFDFWYAIEEDPCIHPTHIALYMALLKHWQVRHFVNPMQVFSYEIMPMAKISSPATYHKRVRDLSDWGYIRYEPSYKKCQGSKIYMLQQ